LKHEFRKSIFSFLAVLVLSTALAPIVQASDELCFCDTEIQPAESSVQPNTVPILYGVWLAEVHDDYVDVHLWYKILDENEFQRTSTLLQEDPEDINTTTVISTYDPNGQRVSYSVTSGTSTPITTYYPSKNYNVDSLANATRHIFAGNTMLSTVTYTPHIISGNNPSCTPPSSGDWTISSSCTFTGAALAPQSVTVNAGKLLTISAGSKLLIDFKHYKLLVKKTGGVLIKKTATLRQVKASDTGTNIYFQHTDHLSGQGITTNSTGAVIELMDYYPYGTARLDEKTGTLTEQRKFIGEEYDNATGLNYLNARYYNSNNGKFISQDPMFWDFDQAWLADPQNQNSYSYARDNPITLSDPSGRIAPLAIAAWMFLAGILGGTAVETYGAIKGDPQVIALGQHTRMTSEFGGAGLIESSGRANPITGRKGLTFEVKPGTLGKVNQNNQARIEAEIAAVRANNLVNSIEAHGAYEKHVVKQGEYGSLFQSKDQWREYVSGIIAKPSESFSGPTKDLYWDARLETVVINNKTGGPPTAFRPPEGLQYYKTEVIKQQEIIKKGGGQP